MPDKSIPSIANPQACEGADCQGCEDCPELNWPTAESVVYEREAWQIERMVDSPARTAAFLELDLFPTEHPTAKAERLERAAEQQAQLLAHKSMPSEAKALLSKNNSRAFAPDGIDYKPAKAPISTHCPNAGWTYGNRVCVAGVPYRTPQPCQKDTCQQCAAFHRWKKLEQYGHGIAGYPEQTQLTIGGLADDNAAADARNYIAKRFGKDGPKRFSQINRNESAKRWEVVITFADVLRMEDFDSQAKVGRLEICLRQQFEDCAVNMETKPIPAFHLERHFYTSKKTPSGHIASAFSQGWIQPYKAPDTYQFGEVELGGVVKVRV